MIDPGPAIQMLLGEGSTTRGHENPVRGPQWRQSSIQRLDHHDHPGAASKRRIVHLTVWSQPMTAEIHDAHLDHIRLDRPADDADTQRGGEEFGKHGDDRDAHPHRVPQAPACCIVPRMHAHVRRLTLILLLATTALITSAPPAEAQVDGLCRVSFNGVEADRIDSLESPLELDTTDSLLFAGAIDSGTASARVDLMIGPVTVESDTTSYATTTSEFTASISLDDVSPYGVGLFRAIGSVDGCTARVWIRVSGRFPLATLTGLTALGLALGGITGQLGAVVSRRRWARSAAALGGIATGSGIAIIAQQFGRFQISYPSLAMAAAVAAILGFAAAWLLNPGLREERRDHRSATVRPAPTPIVTPRPEPRSFARGVAEDTEPADTSPGTIPAPDATPAATPSPDTGPYWCYVMAPTDVFDLTNHTRTIATLTPGTWYLAKRTVGGWAHVVVSDGDEGWVAETAIHRQG